MLTTIFRAVPMVHKWLKIEWLSIKFVWPTTKHSEHAQVQIKEMHVTRQTSIRLFVLLYRFVSHMKVTPATVFAVIFYIRIVSFAKVCIRSSLYLRVPFLPSNWSFPISKKTLHEEELGENGYLLLQIANVAIHQLVSRLHNGGL